MRNREAGFSLLEIMVAFTLLALSLAVLMQAFGSGVGLLGDAGGVARAATLAQSQMARVGIEIPVEEGAYQGEWQAGYRWHLQIAPFYPLQPVPEHPRWQLYQVQVTISWTDADRTRTYRMTTLRVGPRSSAL
ncbi:MAG: type IV pilus modification PilV family protein [Methylohalobius sp. ZOD2]